MWVDHRLRCVVRIETVERPVRQRAISVSSDLYPLIHKLKVISTSSHTALDKDGMEDIESARDVSDDISKGLDCPAATDGDYFAWKMSNIEKILLGGIVDNDPLRLW